MGGNAGTAVDFRLGVCSASTQKARIYNTLVGAVFLYFIVGASKIARSCRNLATSPLFGFHPVPLHRWFAVSCSRYT